MEDYRDRYATAKKKDGTIVGPWRDNFEGMALKTCIRQLSKWMPKSTELSLALLADEGVRVNTDPTAQVEVATHHYDGAETVEGTIEPEIPDPTDAADPWHEAPVAPPEEP